jgi:hypothetical protein
MITLRVLLLILAFVCFLLSAAGVPSRINLQSLGLAFWVLTLLVTV